MKTPILWGLVGLNVLLLSLSVSRFVRENSALAQAQPAGMQPAVAGRPGEYLLCPGSVSGIGSEVVYVIDTLNGQLGAVSYDINGRLATMPGVDLNRTFQAGVGPQSNVNPGIPGTLPPGTIRRP